MSVDRCCTSEDSVGTTAAAAASWPSERLLLPPRFHGVFEHAANLQLPMMSTAARHSGTAQAAEPNKSDGTHLDVHNSATAPRSGGFLIPESWQPKQAQLTIFYAGAVSVYEDVPFDKAKAIMLLAGGGKSWSNNPLPDSVKAPSQGKPAAALSFSPAEPPAFIPYLTEPNQQLVKRSHAELPFARKVSLARFLEKRKDRIHAKLLAAAEQTKGWVEFGEDEARYKKQASSQCSTAPHASKRLCS